MLAGFRRGWRGRPPRRRRGRAPRAAHRALGTAGSPAATRTAGRSRAPEGWLAVGAGLGGPAQAKKSGQGQPKWPPGPTSRGAQPSLDSSCPTSRPALRRSSGPPPPPPEDAPAPRCSRGAGPWPNRCRRPLSAPSQPLGVGGWVGGWWAGGWAGGRRVGWQRGGRARVLAVWVGSPALPGARRPMDRGDGRRGRCARAARWRGARPRPASASARQLPGQPSRPPTPQTADRPTSLATKPWSLMPRLR